MEGGKCSPSGPVLKQQVLCHLLTELLYLRGAECVSLIRLPQLYLHHFGSALPLDCFDVRDLSGLTQLQRVWDGISLLKLSVS